MSKAQELQAKSFEALPLRRETADIARSVLEFNGKDLSFAERRQLPFLIFDSSLNEHQINFADKVIRNFSDSARFWGLLFKAWLTDFRLENPISNIVITSLRDNFDKLPPFMMDLANRYPIISVTPNFNDTAKALLNKQIPQDDLVFLGFTFDGKITTRLADMILQSCALQLSQRAMSLEELAEFEKYVTCNNFIHESVKLHAMVGLILGAKLRSPSEGVVKGIANLIENNYEDPVIGKGSWPAVPESLGGIKTRNLCLETVVKWRVFRSIALFFNIIEKVAETEHRHQFPIRRDFWIKYFDRGIIKDAWVILGTKAENQMQLLNQQSDEYSGLEWAKLSGGRSDQCALLMKVGNMTVMEFSHSGKVRMWGEKDGSTNFNSSVPRLRQKLYKADNLRAACPSNQMFTHDPGGRWRIAAERCIARLSGQGTKL